MREAFIWRAVLDIAPTSQAACEQLCMLLLQGTLQSKAPACQGLAWLPP